MVTVTVSPDAEVLSVRLALNWKAAVDPRGLHSLVLAAANAATIAALARQVADVQRNPPPTPQFGSGQVDLNDETHLTTQDVMRLVDEATGDLERFTERAAAVLDRRVTVESAGGHLTGSVTNGQVVDVSIDSTWASQVRSSEIEGEIIDVLRQLHTVTAAPDLADGPQGSAIAEIMGLLFDPHRMARRVGLEPSAIKYRVGSNDG